jgi:hypothetical protein
MQTWRGLAALSLLALVCAVTRAQTPAAVPLPVARQQFFDSSGRPLAGGKIYTYAAGTSTPLATYTDGTGTVANSNPVILDAGGFGSLWVKVGVYKMVVQNSAGVLQWSADNVTNLSGSGSLSAANITFTASGGGVSQSVANRLGQTYYASDFGAVGNNVTDDSGAINTGLGNASGKRLVVSPSTVGYYINGNLSISANSTLELGAGNYRLGATGQITLAGTGSKLVCPAGPEATVITVPLSYTPTTGAIVLSSGEPAGTVEGCQIAFTQADTSTRATLTRAAWAISAPAQARARIRNVKIVRAWNGIDLSSNAGGATVSDVQISSFNIGLFIDGAQDTIRVSQYHWWPFGLTTNQSNAMYDTVNSFGMYVGRVDGLLIDSSLFFGGQALGLIAGSGGGAPIVFISNSAFDTFGGIKQYAGRCSVADSYFTLARTGVNAINVSGLSSMTVASSFFFLGVTGSTAPVVSVTAGAEFNGTGNVFAKINTYDTTQVYGAGAISKLVLTGNTFENYGGGGTYTNPLIQIDAGARLIASDNHFTDLAGSGIGIKIAADGGHILHDNVLVGWSLNLPGGYTTMKVHDNIP